MIEGDGSNAKGGGTGKSAGSGGTNAAPTAGGSVGRARRSLRRSLRAILLLTASTLGILAGTMAVSSATALAAGPPEVLAQGIPWIGAFETRVEASVNAGEQTTECHVQYGTTSVTENEVACEQATIEGGEQGVSENLTGLTAATKYKYRFALKNGASEEGFGTEEEFETAPQEPPAVPAEVTSSIETLEARVEGTINPNHQETECHVEYGTTSVTENTVPCEQPPIKAPFSEEPVSKTLTGLEAATKYKYRFVAKNQSGEETTGTEEEFETGPIEAPTVSAGNLGWVGTLEARVEGAINPNHEDTECHVEYGTTSVTENTVPCEQATIEASSPETGVGKTLTGLEGATKYKYRFVAKDQSGDVTTGGENEFKTEPVVAPRIISESVSSVAVGEARVEAIVDPSNQVTECHVEYGTTTVTENTVPCETEKIEGPFVSEVPVGVTLSGLSQETIYHFRFVLKNASGEEVQGAEETLGPAKEVETGNAEKITDSTAQVGGALNSGGAATYYIEYGTAPCGVSSCGTRSGEASANGKDKQPVSPITIGESEPLEVNTTYHYWLVATNGSNLSPVHGTEHEFTTLDAAPTEVEAGEAKEITTTSAVIGGEFNPGGESTYYIEYGTALCSPTCGEHSGALTVTSLTREPVESIELSGLKSGTVYHYRLAVENDGVSVPVRSEQGVFRTVSTQAEVQAEKEAELRAEAKPAEELLAALRAQQKVEEEVKKGQEANAAAATAAAKQYKEIEERTAGNAKEELEAKHTEEIIASTAVTITKTKVTKHGVQVTIKVTQSGRVTLAGAGLKQKDQHLAAGTHTVTLAFTSAAKSARKHHKKVTLTAKLETSLTTVSGTRSAKL